MKKGISLIALIITIIVIIILAVITIFGVNGVIEKAIEAKLAQEIATEKEWVSAAVIQAKREMNNFSEETLSKALDSVVGTEQTTVFADSDKFAVQFQASERYYLVDKDGVVEGPIEKVVDEYAGDITKNGQYDGSEEKPYQITCIEDLVAFSIMSHGGNSEVGLKGDNFNNKYVELVKTLDFYSMFSYHDNTTDKYGDLNTDGVKEDIQTELTKTEEGCIGFRQISFSGTFDGKGNTIKNLYMKAASGSLALFGGNAKEIKNLSITGNIESTTWSAAGIYAGSGAITINNCKNYANITGTNFVGGITTWPSDSSIIKDCENYGTIIIAGIGWSYGGAGGIAGLIDNVRIENCKNYGSVVKDNTFVGNSRMLGGIIGEASKSATIINCVNEADNQYGGIIGLAGSYTVNIMNCYNIGNCNSGIAVCTGEKTTELNIINCWNMGKCENGIVNDFSNGTSLNIQNSYNLGQVDNGLIGKQGNNGTVHIENCYNGGESQKAIIGSKANSTTQTNIINTYYNSTKSTDVGVVTDGVTGLTDEEMRNQKTVLETGKTFIEILNENIGANEDWKHWTVGANGYPVFVD